MSEPPSIGLAVAFAAGLLSFLPPCVLPLIPSYVTFSTGMSIDDRPLGWIGAQAGGWVSC